MVEQQQPQGSGPAVTARSAVHAAPVLLARAPEADALVTLAAVDAEGALLLLLGESADLVDAVRRAGPSGLVAAVEASAVTSARLPDRVLARAWLSGDLVEVRGAARCVAARLLASRLGPQPGGRRPRDVAPGEAVLRLAVRHVEVVEGGSRAVVSIPAWAAAAPDPFCAVAQDLVAHLATGHAGEVGLLAARATRARPELRGRPCALVGLDRSGVVLRAVTAGGAVDVRLDFPEPVGCPGELRLAVAALVAEAAGCPRGVRDCEG